ncbi:MAG: hypothetical protein E7619_09430 [Ruminococcaceae bacterium]|nr:hypothetical protein [Oscillospiraceae bacterium]
MLIYCCIAYLLNLVCIVIFKSELRFTSLSLMPALLTAIMLFQAFYFKSEKTDANFQTAHGSVFTAEEQNEIQSYISKALFITAPLILPFAFFFSSPIKLLSILVYIIGYVSAPIIYRAKNKEKINSRLKLEEKQRKEQELNEEMGRLK